MTDVLPVCLSIDVDVLDHVRLTPAPDELSAHVPALADVLAELGTRATFFLRLDDAAALGSGGPDYLRSFHGELLARLRRDGHELGWHFHSFRAGDPQRGQETDEARVLAELRRHAPTASALGMRAVRMGWGFHTNATMAAVAELGFAIDSSAIPRPRYAWELSMKNWVGTGSTPYWPSVADFRVAGVPQLGVLEVPISTTLVPAPYDQEPVVRYLNPAYHEQVFQAALRRWLMAHRHVVLITHPYEVCGQTRGHGLLSFRMTAFRRNLNFVVTAAGELGRVARFETISGFAAGIHGRVHVS